MAGVPVAPELEVGVIEVLVGLCGGGGLGVHLVGSWRVELVVCLVSWMIN